MLKIISLKDEKIFRKKMEIKRKNFNVDQYISQLSEVKPLQLNRLGRRKSFLQILQCVDEKSNYEKFLDVNLEQKANPTKINNIPEENANKSLQISLYHGEDLMFADSYSEIDMRPAEITLDDKYIEEDLDFEELN